jgi:small-conductance mechanosensitive channel
MYPYGANITTEDTIMSRLQKIFMGTFSLFLLSATLLASTAFCETIQNHDDLRHRIENFSVLIAEEQTTLEQTTTLIKSSKLKLTKIMGSYQQLFIARNALSGSPLDRKHFEASLSKLSKDNVSLVEDLKNALATTELRIDLLQSYDQLAVSTGDIAPSLYEEYDAVWKQANHILALSQEQLANLAATIQKADQLFGRIEKIRKGEKTLYELWEHYFFSGKTPVFSLDYWENVLPSTNWLTLKLSEITNAVASIKDNILKFVFLFLTFLALGLSAKKVLKRYLNFTTPKKNSEIRARSYYVLAMISLSLFLTTRIYFPAAMESLSSLTAGIFLLSILKLSKYLRADDYLSTYGNKRLAFLFILSTQLLTLGLPGRTTNLVFLIIVILMWTKDSIIALRNKGQTLSITAMRGGSLAPLFILAIFGYGRLACLFTILWCLGVFIRVLGTLWSQILFMGTQKSAKLQKGLSKSLLVPLGWAGAFLLPYLWFIDFFGENTVSTILEYKITLGDYSLYLKNVISLFILFFLTKHCIAAFNLSTELVGSRWQKAKRGAVPSIQTLTTYAVWSLSSLLALRILGVSLTSITVIAGGLSVGIGFGLQNVVNNFVSGLILLFGRSIQQGDVIEMGGVWCTVKKINIRTTIVETFESAVIIIPNSDLVTTQLTNWTKNNSSLRRDILVGVAYGSDTEKVKKTLAQVADEHPHVLKNPAAYVHFNDFGSSSLDFILRVWIDDIDNTIKSTSELRFAIDAAFRREGIEIAFPQLDVHFKTAPALAYQLKQGE